MREKRSRWWSKKTWSPPPPTKASKIHLHVEQFSLKLTGGASLAAQWLRIHLPMQGTRVRALVREDPTCHGATKPVRHNYWACALEPASHNYWSPRATTTEACVPRAHAPQREKPPQWEAHALQGRVAPAHGNQRKPACSNEDLTQPKIKNKLIN